MKTEYTIEDFCDKHAACRGGREWAISNCETMHEAWNKCSREHLLWIATRDGVLTHKELRLFAVFCARQNQHLLKDQRSLDAIDIAEKYAHGQVTDDALAAAWAAARAAAGDAAGDAAWAAAWTAARAAAGAAARAAAGAAAWDAASAAASAAAGDAASAAAGDAAGAAAGAAARAAAWDEQCQYLRENTKPNFYSNEQ